MSDALAPDNSWDGILQPGEELLWQGQPSGAPEIKGMEMVFGLFFTGFSIFWMSMAAQAGGIFWMFGLIFFFIGLRKSLGQLIWDPVLKRGTFYSLTNQRAFIATRHPVMGKTLKTFTIDQNTELEHVHGRNEAIFFAAEQHYGRHGNSFKTKVGFEGLADAAVPYRILSQIKAGDV